MQVHARANASSWSKGILCAVKSEPSTAQAPRNIPSLARFSSGSIASRS